MPRRRKTAKPRVEEPEEDILIEDVEVVEEPEEKPLKKTAPKKKAPPKKKSPPKRKAAPKPKKSPPPKEEVSSDSSDSSDPDDNETPVKPPAKKSQRSFQVLVETIVPEVNKEDMSAGGGRYVGNMPSQAARKAFNKIARIHSKDETCTDKPCVYVFSIKEITRGSNQRVFSYEGERVLLKKPREIKRGDTSYAVKYETKLKSLRGKNKV